MKRDAHGSRSPLPPGSVIGILGGGQLGRMTAQAAARLGYRAHVYCPDAGAPATQVTSLSTCAPYHDRQALADFADAVDVVTFEFENVPSVVASQLAERVPVHPSPRVLATCQHRLREKDFLSGIGVPTTRYLLVPDAAALKDAVAELGVPAVLKTVEMGYDGKGQVAIDADTDLDEAWATISRHAPGVSGVLEAFVDFEMEISVVVARDQRGQTASFIPVLNEHRHHVLWKTTAPAPISDALAKDAVAKAHRVAEAFDLVGVVAIEMFVTRDGAVLANELAPRPHNSGHWTVDACHSSQFEQLVRAAVGLPLGSPARHSDAVMENLLGDDALSWAKLAAEPGAYLHLYGKADVRPGRKMGHVTRLMAHDDFP